MGRGQLEFRCLRQLLVIQIRSVVEHLFETPQVASAGNDRVERGTRLEHACKFMLVKGRKQVRRHVNRCIGNRDSAHVGNKIRGATALGSQAHHLFAQIKTVGVNAFNRAHNGSVVALAAADIEQRQRLPTRMGGDLLAHGVHQRVAQGGIIILV